MQPVPHMTTKDCECGDADGRPWDLMWIEEGRVVAVEDGD